MMNLSTELALEFLGVTFETLPAVTEHKIVECYTNTCREPTKTTTSAYCIAHTLSQKSRWLT
jgi:hypothetical protein